MSLNASNTDQTGAVIVQLAQAAEQGFQLVASGGLSGVTPKAAPQTTVSTEQVKNSEIMGSSSKLINQFKPKLSEKSVQSLEQEKSLNKQFIQKLQNKDGQSLENFQPDAFDALKKSCLISSINELITSTDEWDTKEYKDNGVVIRPETELIGELVKHSVYSTSLKPLLHRMIIEDATGPLITPINYTQFLYEVMRGQPKPAFPQTIDISFNPFDANELVPAMATLGSAGITLENTDDFLGPKQFDAYSNWSAAPKQVDGIYYRPPMPFEIRLRDNASNVVSRTVLLPNRSPILHLDLDKNTFSSRVSSVTLTNGFISSYSLTKPSSALAVATLPVTLLNGLTASVTNLIQLRINLATGQNTLASALITQQQNQITAISNTIALLSAQQRLLAAQTNSTAH